MFISKYGCISLVIRLQLYGWSLRVAANYWVVWLWVHLGHTLYLSPTASQRLGGAKGGTISRTISVHLWHLYDLTRLLLERILLFYPAQTSVVCSLAGQKCLNTTKYPYTDCAIYRINILLGAKNENWNIQETQVNYPRSQLSKHLHDFLMNYGYCWICTTCAISGTSGITIYKYNDIIRNLF